MLTGLNHITIGVSDLERSFDFYVSLLGMRPIVKWDAGAYLTVESIWICLSLGKAMPARDYSHISFTVPATEFEPCCSRLISSEVKTWKENSSEGDSLYFLDPDGHKLEIHAGDLNSRLKDLKSTPTKV